MSLRDRVRIQTLAGETVRAHGYSVTPEAWSLQMRWPWGGLVWNRPVAVIVDDGEKEERIPIVDVTRITQISLLVSVFLVGLILKATGRPRQS